MKELLTGGNAPLDGDDVVITVDWRPATIRGLDIDAAAFALAENGRVRDEDDFVFYNQPSHPSGAIALSGGDGAARFAVTLSRLPAAVEKVAFTLTVHGDAAFSEAEQVRVGVEGQLQYAPERGREAALILAELYRRGGAWKFRAVGQGFEGGLAPLATHFGVAVDEDQEPAPAAAPAATAPSASASRVRLEKKLVDLEKKAPKLVSLAKQARVSLEKRNLDAHTAQVALVMDISGSMSGMFSKGTVQAVIEQVLGLAINFDDNSAIDVFAFGKRAHDLGELTPERFEGAADWILKETGFEGGTNYGPAVESVMAHYGYMTAERVESKGFLGRTKEKVETRWNEPPQGAPLPVYVLFVTDGDNFDKANAERIVREAARYPVFFQFVGIGGGRFGFLEQLDDLSGRFLDNADFFEVDDPTTIAADRLYDLMTAEYPAWVGQARQKGILR